MLRALVVLIGLLASCLVGCRRPAVTSTNPPRATHDPTATGYQVLILAASGYHGSLYVARSPAACTSGVQAAAFGRLVEEVSAPWRLVRRDTGAATLAITPRRCDGVDDYATLTGGVVTAAVARPSARCGVGRPVLLRLAPEQVGAELPRTLRHGPIGALDVTEP
jgi:hypothetical protein